MLKMNGENVLQEIEEEKCAESVFAEQFADLLVIILIIAAIISMVSGNVESTIVIFAVITMNAILGTVQHEKAEKSLASLKTLSAPTAKVLRGGVKGEIPSAQVVKGDILLLEAGDMVTADGRILESYSLQVNESSLTGESTNVEKKAVVLEGETGTGRPYQYGLFRKSGNRGTCGCTGDSYGHGDRDRQDCGAYECYKGEENTAAGEP